MTKREAFKILFEPEPFGWADDAQVDKEFARFDATQSNDSGTFAVLTAYVFGRIDALQEEYDFDVNDGWAQVHARGGEKNRAYGEWSELHHLVKEFGLSRVEPVIKIFRTSGRCTSAAHSRSLT